MNKVFFYSHYVRGIMYPHGKKKTGAHCNSGITLQFVGREVYTSDT